ncbi:hypothetical protein Scep_025719 [Stephania cephalantha]|uniref:Uncharacterized protein n=1 Tax=Stephania cephalantha TaxID=152367 RepID=A0AAP0ELA1_9MAGN
MRRFVKRDGCLASLAQPAILTTLSSSNLSLTRHSHHSLPHLSLSLATFNSLSRPILLNAESLSPEICLPNPKITSVCTELGPLPSSLSGRRVWEEVPIAVLAVGPRRCRRDSLRVGNQGRLPCLCRRWSCAPRRHSPLFVVAAVERSSIVAASPFATALAVCGPRAVRHSSSRLAWASAPQLVSATPPPFKDIFQKYLD